MGLIKLLFSLFLGLIYFLDQPIVEVFMMKLQAILLWLPLLAVSETVSAININSKDSLTICRNAILADAGETQYKFNRKTATSVKKEQFTHWINVIEISETDKVPVKVLCETSRDGTLLTIEFKPGRWKI